MSVAPAARGRDQLPVGAWPSVYTLSMAKGLPRIPSWRIWVGTAVFAALMAVLVIWVLPLVLTRHPHVVDVKPVRSEGPFHGER